MKVETWLTYVCIELPDETREVVVLEELWQQISGKLRRVPNNKALITGTPRHNRIGWSIIHHIVGLGKERRQRAGATLNFIHSNQSPKITNPNPKPSIKSSTTSQNSKITGKLTPLSSPVYMQDQEFNPETSNFHSFNPKTETLNGIKGTQDPAWKPFEFPPVKALTFQGIGGTQLKTHWFSNWGFEIEPN